MTRAGMLTLAVLILGSASATGQEQSAPVLPEPTCCGCWGDCSEFAPPEPRLWVGADYLLWWISRGPQSTPLVTTGDPGDAPPGALGQPGTAVLFGGSGLNYGTFSGVRATLGGWLDDDRRLGLEASGFLLERRSIGFAAGSDGAGTPPLYVPLFNVMSGQEGSFTIADPVFGSAGSIAVRSASRLWGYEGYLVANAGRADGVVVDLLAGCRYLQLAENLGLAAATNDLVADIQGLAVDQFSTRNSFVGGQLAGRVTLRSGPVALELLGKLALGNTHQVVSVGGFTYLSGTGLIAPTLTAGGILTAPSNIGVQARDQFSIVPQLGVKAGWNLGELVRATVGYDFLYWSSVARPGQQIDRAINPTQQFGGTLVGPALPAPLFQRTDLIAHGVNFGLELRF